MPLTKTQAPTKEKNQPLLFLAKNPKPETKQQSVTKTSKSPMPSPKTQVSAKPPTKPEQAKDIRRPVLSYLVKEPTQEMKIKRMKKMMKHMF